MSNTSSNPSRLQQPSSRLTAPTSRLSKPVVTKPAVTRTGLTVTKRTNTSSTSHHSTPHSLVNNTTDTSIADTELSSIRSDRDGSHDETARNISSSSSLGSISMARTALITSRSSTVNSLNKCKQTNSNGGFKNDTYSVNDEKSGGNIVKNIEEVIARNKILEEENNVLKSLIHEENEKTGRFDERRLLMLKCQIYQLEKQINILSKSLAFRKNAHTDALNTLSVFADTFRSTIQAAEGRSLTPVKTFSIERNDFVKWTDLAESTRIKLIKTEDSTMNDDNIKDMSEASLLTTKFCKSSDGKIDILDVCSGDLSHINLKQVALLESDLSQLFKKLTRLKESLKTNLNEPNSAQNNPKLLPMHKDNLSKQLQDCCSSTQDSCSKLFDLMLLVPSAPWPIIKKSPIDKFTQDQLIGKLKSLSLPKSKYQSVEVLLRSYYVASNYHHHMKSNELAAAEEELTFYRSSYTVQKDYIESVMKLFMEKYEKFIEELRDNLNVPLSTLIKKFWEMKDESTEENLKEFLGYFKQYAKKFEGVICNIEKMPKNDLIGNTFHQLIAQLDTELMNLNALCKQGVEKLDLNMISLRDLSRQSDQILGEIVSLTPINSD